MKLAIHVSVLSMLFAGFCAAVVTTKQTAPAGAHRGLILSYRMPVPNCPPDKGCPVKMQ